MPKKKVKADYVDHITKVMSTCPYCGMDGESEEPLNIENFEVEIECGECEKKYIVEVSNKTQQI